MSPRYPRLLSALLVLCVIWPLSLQVEARGKKKRTSASSSKSRSSKRYSAKKSRRGRNSSPREFSAEDISQNYPVVPDSVEVMEYGSTDSVVLARYLNLPSSRSQLSQGGGEPITPITPRPRTIRIDSSRTIQIQQALASRGFYAGELTGIYDEATVDAMRRFQTGAKIAATGYPTAHALKRLGLGSW